MANLIFLFFGGKKGEMGENFKCEINATFFILLDINTFKQMLNRNPARSRIIVPV